MKYIYLLGCVLLFVSCNDELMQPSNKPTSVFDQMSKRIEETYSMMELKNLDWPTVHKQYRALVDDGISQDSLFTVCSLMLFELKDGHCFLTDNNGEKSAVYDFTQGYYVTPDLTPALNYIGEYKQWRNFLITSILENDIGYINYIAFNKSEAGYWQQVLEYMKNNDVKKIIIDVRSNPGGEPLIAQNLCGYFITKPTKVGTMFHKSNKGKNDFIGPLTLTSTPKQPYLGDIPVILLTNRASFSSSSYLAGMMEALPNVIHIGQITGGGGGGFLPYELPNGWVVGITNNYFLDVKGKHIELGVTPDILVENTPEDFEEGRDRMLEAAISYNANN
ncbi:MAG: S41 family peptidase [Flammeovirgaceae bacterium]|jgi:hypothetical protein|nr:S41 family peptidase [Flammeovirgaceae bacterium]